MAETESDIRITTDIQYLALAGEQRDVCWKDFGKKWPRYNGTELYSLTLKNWSLCSSTQLTVWPDELGCGLRGTPGTPEFTTLMQVIVLPLAYRCRQRPSRWLYQRWPALAGNGRSALSPAQSLPTRKAKILLAVLYLRNTSIHIQQYHDENWDKFQVWIYRTSCKQNW